MIFHKKQIILILTVSVLTFGNSLFNGFLGDDETVIVNNTFYKSAENVRRIFDKSYITNDENVLLGTVGDKGSGSVGYRPVLTLSFFYDYWIWKLNPFGYHLTNFILHIANTFLVYFLIFYILERKRVALLCALLFCVHPMKSEAVCNIGYRADVLSGFFTLVSVLCFVRYRNFIKVKKNVLFGLSLLFYFLALFTKESAIVLPALIAAYDFTFRKNDARRILKNLLSRYLGFICITAVYLYLYFFVFTNTRLNQLTTTLVFTDQLVRIAQVFLSYLIGIILPFMVKALPSQYAPPVSSLSLLWSAASAALAAAFVVLIFKTFRHSRFISFFLFWFLAAYLPVSNIIPLPNPIAYRFLYLPSIGILTVIAFLIDQSCSNPDNFKKIPNLGKIFRVAVIVFCMIATVILNSVWKNNYTMSWHLIRNYPSHPQGYLIMGVVAAKAKLYEQAKQVFEKSIELGAEDPRAYHMMGVLSSNDRDKAKSYFSQCIQSFPRYAICHSGLGRIYLFEGEYEKARETLRKSVSLAPSYTGYGYLIQANLLLRQDEAIPLILREAQQHITESNYLDSLRKFTTLEKRLKEPIDIGL